MTTSFKTFNPEDNAQDYIVKKVGMTIQLIHLPSRKVIDYRLLSEHILDINPAWFEHYVFLAKHNTLNIVIAPPMPEFICKHNSMIDKHEKEQMDYLATMN